MKIENNINSNINTIKDHNKQTKENNIDKETINKKEVVKKNSEVDISIMNQLQKLKNESFDNKDKIERLKNEINSNQYSIDTVKLSKKIMDFEFQLQKLKD